MSGDPFKCDFEIELLNFFKFCLNGCYNIRSSRLITLYGLKAVREYYTLLVFIILDPYPGVFNGREFGYVY